MDVRLLLKTARVVGITGVQSPHRLVGTFELGDF
jgi:hypothetical protein